MVVSYGDRVAIGGSSGGTTYDEWPRAAAAGSSLAGAAEAQAVVFVAPNHVAFPIALFSAAAAGLPFIPLNYRLADEQLEPLVAAHPGALVVAEQLPVPGADPARSFLRQRFLDELATVASTELLSPAGPDDTAVVLYTSGTSGVPKAALLRRRHLASCLLGPVDFASADPEEAALVTVPPYHIAGIANLLSNLYAGRRIVYIESFDPETWLATVRNERITQAMVVPTMLARLVYYLDGHGADVPTLRTLSYGGSRMPLVVLEKALAQFGDTGFVNAYGLTETSSTIALLGPD